MSTTTAYEAGDGCPPAAPAPSPRPVLLDAAATTRCRRRVHLEHVPPEDLGPGGVPAGDDADPGVAMRRADAAAHRAVLAGRWAELLGSRWAAVPPAPTAAARVVATRELLADDERRPDVVGNAELPAAEGRRGGAEALVRAVPGDPASGWWPLIVVRHRVTDPGEGALTSPLGQPHPEAATWDETRRVRTVTRDVLRLAHLHRMLRAAGLAPPEEPDAPVWGGVVGMDADAVVWIDLADAGAGGRSALETYDRRHGDRLAVAEAARSRGPALAEPSRITECRRCPWWPTCEAALRAVDDVSLVVRGDAALRLRGRGVTTVRELAALDPAAGLPGPEPDPEVPEAGEVPDLVEAVALARAWSRDVPLVRRVERPAVARGDVEVDVDMESLGEDGAYLWGALLTGADIGLEQGYRAFVTWDPLPTRDEGRSFGEFWTWLADVRARCAARGLVLRAYCYNEQAENRWLRASAERFAGMAGVPPAEEVEEFIASEAWIDLFPAVSESFLCPHGKGLKRVAPSAGFAWHDPEAGGENSMRWYRDAVGLDGGEPDPAQRERLLVYNADDVRATWTLRTWMTSERVLEVPHLADL
ncbi:TM0106 family RecB-like putative nuclease [Actinomycetospora lemnae]|uniref:TM0106 family RecB-like putative nuclease n=1 Tax=Actinomycetospora lemnae TaxID=3019891 RepID=A0ABT5STT3_9PSEU|nr:TM0106 family RecB-like putative nuclease [Actinomycetospora sp. DW7H6]MDD7966263.1 TM0106 family RecB-like putative nuclease [Actinomycetospora sp. DW7H6]